MAKAPGNYDRAVSKEQRSEEQLQRLLDAGARVFAERGYAGSSVAHVLDACDVGRGTFYRHFEGLEDLFLAVTSAAVELLESDVRQAIAEQPDTLAKLRVGIERFLAVLADNTALARVLLRGIKANMPHEDANWPSAFEHFQAMFTELLPQAVDEGLLPRLPTDMQVHALLSAIEGVALQYVLDGTPERAQEAAPMLYRMCLRTLTDPGEAPPGS